MRAHLQIGIELDGIQQGIGTRLAPVQRRVRTVFFASIGIWGISYDGMRSLARDTARLLTRAESRGQQIESGVLSYAQQLEQETLGLLNVGDEGETGLIETARRGMEFDVEKQVEAILDRLGIPSRSRLDQLSREIDALMQLIDERLAAAEPGRSTRTSELN
jgi:hypothetical protein